MMNASPQLPWDPEFPSRSPLYEPLRRWADVFSAFRNAWPGLDDYQRVLDGHGEPILTATGKPIKIVKQDAAPGCFEEHYAPRIYFTGEIQTRTGNWHDFFQFLTWVVFPKTKAAINAIHIPAARQRLCGAAEPGRRSAIENMLSLFDEGGAIVVSSDKSLLQLIRDFRWKTLFWERRDELAAKLQCITFGHALYEKALAPYVGMTANCILLPVDDDFFCKELAEQLAWLDTSVAQLFATGEALSQPKDLHPLPILGLPGLDPDNEQETYYGNTGYFRPARRPR